MTKAINKKSYVIDTNVFLQNPNCIDVLRNGNDNDIYVPYKVLLELDNLKKNNKVMHLVAKAVDSLNKNIDHIHIIGKPVSPKGNTDLDILNDIQLTDSNNDFIFITNDNLLSIFSTIHNVKTEKLKAQNDYISDAKLHTGLLKSHDENFYHIKNYFMWEEGKLFFYKNSEVKAMSFDHEVWKIKPRHYTQNMAMELLMDDDIDIISIAGNSGYGKTYISLAVGLHKVLQEKKYEKIVFIKPTIEIGKELGFLPGEASDKILPYNQYAIDLLQKLDKERKANKIFLDDAKNKLNPDKFKFLPINYVRGMNIENSYVIIEEAQNFKPNEMRAILTRMGENVKCVCLGDTNQVDNHFLTEANNGLNRVVRKLLPYPNYAHIVMKGDRSRGPITDIVLDSEL